MGYMEGDELLKLNRKKVTFNNINNVIDDYFSNVKAGDILKVTVARKKPGKSKAKKVKLKGTVFPVNTVKKYTPVLLPDATLQQQQTREAWIGKH
jgi:hypothetical protein